MTLIGYNQVTFCFKVHVVRPCITANKQLTNSLKVEQIKPAYVVVVNNES